MMLHALPRPILWLNTNWDGKQEDETQIMMLANIADGAQVNKMESVKVNGAAQAIAADKSVNISVPVIYAQADQPAGLKAGDMWFQIIE